MRRLHRIGLALAALAVLGMTAAPAIAGGCHVSYGNYGYGYAANYAQNYVAPYVEKVVVAAFLQVPVVAYPVVGVGAAPPAAPAAAVEQKADPSLEALAAELKALRAELSGLRGAGMKALTTRQEVVAARCAACHGADVAPSKGAGFVLLEKDGKLSPLSVPDQKRIKRLAQRGTMPPKDSGHVLSADELKILIEGW